MRNVRMTIWVMVVGLCLINSPVVLADCPSADLTGDCFVDFEDFALMAAQWLTTDPCVPDDMAYIPDGEFEMGDHLGDGDGDELPIHLVLLDSFFMSKFEITNRQYCDYLNSAEDGGDIWIDGGIVYGIFGGYPYFYTYSEGSSYSQITYSDSTFSVRTRDGNSMDEHPVVDLNWYGSVAYCNWRSSQEGYPQCYSLSTWECDFSKHGYRLPTEAEWEYAARGGCHEPYYKYAWCDNSIDCSKANLRIVGGGLFCNPLGLSSFPYTSPVGYYSANNYGLFDMTGNILEWCNDWYNSGYYDVSPYDNPQGPTVGSKRVLRGGCWAYPPLLCRVADRISPYPATYANNLGFRVVLDLN